MPTVNISSSIVGQATVNAALLQPLQANISGAATVTPALSGIGGNANISASIAGQAVVRGFLVPPPGPPPAPAPYKYATYSDALNALGSRLYDPTFQQWTQAELLGYLYEALRTWNALSQFWRGDMVFSPIVNTWWYDLRTLTTSIIPYSVTQFDLIQQIENHLLEPPTPSAWSGSNQFSLNDLLIALQRRQDDVLGTTACTLTRSLAQASIAARTVLADNVIDIRRVAWLPVLGFGYDNTILRQSDMWAKRAFDPFYTTDPQEPPGTWLQNTEPPPSFDVDRIPPVPGNYDVLSVNSGGSWTQGTNAPLAVPADWSWVVKWGALFDLFSRESNAKDNLRAEYCRKRFEEGMVMLEAMPTVLALRINNIPLAVDSVRNGDDFNPDWQTAGPTWLEISESWNNANFSWNAPLGPPRSAYTAANLMAITPTPGNSTRYSMTVSVVQNAPVGGTYVQVARDDFDSIIDYAQHLAMLKQGGAEFAATIPLYQRFQRKAAQYNSKLKEMGFFSMDQLEISQEQESRSPRYLSRKVLVKQ
jgi:hypothetical protein